MRRKKNSFLDHLEYYLGIYLPMAKGLSSNTIVSYKATFRILMEYMYSIKGVPADKVDFNILDDKLIIEFLDWLEVTRGCRDRKSTRLNSSHTDSSRMPSSA